MARFLIEVPHEAKPEACALAVKTKYDPSNLFRVNWNIKPGT